MIRLLTGRRRLLRKRMYKSPHERHRLSYLRGNKNLNKKYQDEFKNKEKIFKKRRPKREAVKGFKMSYRYKLFSEEDEKEEDES